MVFLQAFQKHIYWKDKDYSLYKKLLKAEELFLICTSLQNLILVYMLLITEFGLCFFSFLFHRKTVGLLQEKFLKFTS